MLNHFSALPNIFRLCWALLGSSKHLSSMLSVFPAMLCIILLYCVPQQSRKNAQHSWKMLGRAETPLSIEEKWLEEPRRAQHRRKMLGKGKKWSVWKKNAWQSWKQLSMGEKTARQSRNVHIRGVLYLWATVINPWRVANSHTEVQHVSTVYLDLPIGTLKKQKAAIEINIILNVVITNQGIAVTIVYQYTYGWYSWIIT